MFLSYLKQFSQFPNRFSVLSFGFLLSGFSLLGLFSTSCSSEKEGVCFTDSSCPSSQICVNTRCVGNEIEIKAPYTLYKEEFHNRLAAQCGICHASREEPPAEENADLNEDEMMVNPDDAELQIDPFKLPALSLREGDSGWRININASTEEDYFKSYQDTLQYLNFYNPDQSLLLLYGKGEIPIGKVRGIIRDNEGMERPGLVPVPHPQFYQYALPEPEEGDLEDEQVEEQVEEPVDVTQLPDISFARTLSWVRLITNPDLLTLDEYTNPIASVQDQVPDSPQDYLSRTCSGCHAANNPAPDGGFYFRAPAESPADLYPLLPLMNFEQPEESALIRIRVGEYGHQMIFSEQNPDDDYTALMTAWMEEIKTRLVNQKLADSILGLNPVVNQPAPNQAPPPPMQDAAQEADAPMEGTP